MYVYVGGPKCPPDHMHDCVAIFARNVCNDCLRLRLLVFANMSRLSPARQIGTSAPRKRPSEVMDITEPEPSVKAEPGVHAASQMRGVAEGTVFHVVVAAGNAGDVKRDGWQRRGPATPFPWTPCLGPMDWKCAGTARQPLNVSKNGWRVVSKRNARFL